MDVESQVNEDRVSLAKINSDMKSHFADYEGVSGEEIRSRIAEIDKLISEKEKLESLQMIRFRQKSLSKQIEKEEAAIKSSQ